jgi:hypothetical protein
MYSARNTTHRHTREGGYPVRRGFSDKSHAALEYWIIRIRG